MAAQAGGEACCGIGTRLQSARERKGLTILQAAERLHVDAGILESLEAENFSALGAPVFVRGHLRHYAELIGEPPVELQELYSSTSRTVQPDLTRIPRAEPADLRRLFVPAVAVLVGFALAGTVWWVHSLSGVTLPSGDQATPVQIRGAAEDNTTLSPAGAGATAPASGAAAPPPAGARRSATGASVRAGPGNPGSGTAQPQGGQSAIAGAPPPPRPAAAHGRQTALTLKFSADSWAEVYDASGQRLFYDVGAADSARTLKGTPPLSVVLGNAPGVAIEVNGRRAAISTVVQPDGSAHFLINAYGRAVRAKQAGGG